jgi:nitrogen regulatory protein P-II 1
MKKLEIIIRPDRLEDLKQILNGYAVGGMTVFSVMGCGNQKGDISELKGMKLVSMNLIPKIQANVVVEDDVVDDILNLVTEKLASGRVGDGKVFVYPVEEAMRIRTGERGTKAI